MQLSSRLLSIVLLFSLQACSSARLAAHPPSNPKGVKINKIVDDYFESYLKLYPLFATSIGDHRFDDLMPSTITEQHRHQELALVESSLTQVQDLGCNELNHQDTLTCETFARDMQTNLEVLKTDLDHLMPINQFESFFSEFAELASGSSYVSFDHEADYRHFLNRMNLLPAVVDSAIENMKLGVKKKVTTPAILVKKAQKQIHDLLVPDYKQSVFYKPLTKLDTMIPLVDRGTLKADYEKAIQKSVYPAYQKLEAYVSKEYLPHARKSHGLGALPGGKQAYLALVKSQTTTDLTPDQVMQLGLSEVKRIRAQFEEVKTQFGFKGTLKEFFVSIRNDPKLFPFHTDEEVLNAYRAIYAKVMQQVPDHFHLMPKARFEIREVEKFKAESASEAYQNATPDGSRPGIFWVPIPDATKYGKKDMESLFLHEAIPGHHFQVSIQQETDLPRYRRFNGNNAYVEGWALYCEGLGRDLGMYTDPYQWVGRLENEMHRAIRLVVDTGIHSQGWTREKAIQYSLDNEPGDEAGIVSEIERYMVIPGQALSYKLGELDILKLKARAQKALGVTYRDRDFHDEILKDGPLPLAVLDQKITEWIQSKTPIQSSIAK